jgi:hypothetical protein
MLMGCISKIITRANICNHDYDNDKSVEPRCGDGEVQ